MKPVRESIIPGIIASPLSVDDGESVGHDLSWGGGQDSFYEVTFFVEMMLIVVSYQDIRFVAKPEDAIVSRSVVACGRKYDEEFIQLERSDWETSIISISRYSRS